MRQRKARKQKTETRYKMNLMKLMDRFGDEAKCHTYLEELRWPNGLRCPRCESPKVYYTQTRKQYECDPCGYHFSVTSGTMLHDTHLPLRKWLVAVYLMIESKKGISANQMRRTLNVHSKTAWYLCHRIRAAMSQAQANSEPLSGIVEADETFVGGKVRGMGHGYKGNKAVVVGVVERGGEIRLQVAEDRTRKVLRETVLSNTAPDTEAIYTDDWEAYQGIGDGDTKHDTVNHSAEEWVRGDVHTNTAESVWSLLKRSIIGSYHHVSVKHLDAYLDELEWRFGNRNNPWLFRDTLLKLLESENLPYAALVSG